MIYETIPHYWVNHLGFQLRKQLEAAFAAGGHRVTSEEWALLLILNAHQPLSPSDLSRLTLRDTTTVSRLVDRLEGKALVARYRNRPDRRIVDIQMTPAGQGLFAELSKIAQRIIQSSLAGIPAQDIDVTLRVLSKMSDNLTEGEAAADV